MDTEESHLTVRGRMPRRYLSISIISITKHYIIHIYQDFHRLVLGGVMYIALRLLNLRLLIYLQVNMLHYFCMSTPDLNILRHRKVYQPRTTVRCGRHVGRAAA